MEQTATALGTDIISMVQGLGIFRCFMVKPTTNEIGTALWVSSNYWSELDELYNVFAWYTFEEIAHIWNRYLEDNPVHAVKLSA